MLPIGLVVEAIHFTGMETEALRFGNHLLRVTQLVTGRAQRAQVSKLPDPVPDLLINARKA